MLKFVYKLLFIIKQSSNINLTTNRYLIDQGMVEKSKNSIVIYEDQRQIHFPVSNKNLHNNSFNNNRVIINNSRPGRLKNIPLNNMQGEMIPVTQEIEVVTDFIKVEADNNNYSFNNTPSNNNNNDSYVIQLVQNNNNNRNNIQPNQPNYKSSVDASLSNLGLPVNSRNQQLNEVKDGKIYMCGLCNKVHLKLVSSLNFLNSVFFNVNMFHSFVNPSYLKYQLLQMTESYIFITSIQKTRHMNSLID